MARLSAYLISTFLLLNPSLGILKASPNDYFTIEVIDSQTGRGVPLVELRTVNNASWWTDSNGLIAFNEPGLMDLDVYFHVTSPGYEYPMDLLGNRGVKLRPTAGGLARIALKRLNVAERLYRITGQGIYRDSALLGRTMPLKHPLLNGQVLGQDTVIATSYRGYWFWGDTDRPSYPLGNLGASGATSELPRRGGLDPSVGVDLTYFVDATGFSKPVCPLPKGDMHWIESLLTLPDANGVEHLLARVGIMPGLDEAREWHLMLFDDAKQEFQSICKWDVHDRHQSAHPFQAAVNGTNYYYLFPDLRVPATLTSVSNLSLYEAFTCLAGDGKWHGRETTVEQDRNRRVQYAWRKGAERLGHERFGQLVDAGKVHRDENWARLLDFETGTALSRGLESVAWNAFRRRWIAFFADKAGEVWFAEADTPLGPWGYGRRVVTHGDYNFYNIAHHPFFNQDSGRIVYFEGTYTAVFSDARSKTPRYDYNQIMYRLSLDDPRLALPVALYRVRNQDRSTSLLLREQVEAAGAWPQVECPVCFVLPPNTRGTNLVAMYSAVKQGTVLSLTPPTPDAGPLFFGLPSKEPGPDNSLAGSWQGRARSSENNELDFSLHFSVQDKTVIVGSPGIMTNGLGTFEDGRLKLTLNTDEGAFLLEAKLDHRTLAGKWRKQQGTLEGTWSATAVDATPAERCSPALVVLREYQSVNGEQKYYSTDAQPPSGYQPSARELCRVWSVVNQITLPTERVIP